VLIQGPTIPLVARWLGVDSPVREKTRYPIELEPSVDTKAALKEIEITEKDYALNKQILELGLPDKVLTTLINRNCKFMEPHRGKVIKKHDKLLSHSSNKDVAAN